MKPAAGSSPAQACPTGLSRVAGGSGLQGRPLRISSDSQGAAHTPALRGCGTVSDMRLHLAFGKNGLPIDLPAGLRLPGFGGAFRHPIAGSGRRSRRRTRPSYRILPLIDMARGKSSAAISVCDITRPAPNRQVLPHVLTRLEDAGIPAGRDHYPDRHGATPARHGCRDPRDRGRRDCRPIIAWSTMMPATWPHTATWAARRRARRFTSTIASFPPTCISPWGSSNRT